MKTKTIAKHLLLCILVVSIPLFATSPEKIRALYHSLDPTSLRAHLVFYELYKETDEGKKALQDAWKLIAKDKKCAANTDLSFPENIDAFITLVHPVTGSSSDVLIEKASSKSMYELCSHLANRSLKGSRAQSIDEIETLSSDDIDLARALLLSQDTITQDAIGSYEAMLDLMALEVLARLPETPSFRDKIEALNHFIFHEMGFRFPPQSSYSEHIDRFTFLPQVLESKKGVCLGVSMLYLCLAQRIDLPLEIVTPPGHIFLRYTDETSERNIETTHRGVHIPSHEYLQLNTKFLQTRSLKEVIGMLHFNHASVYLAKQDFKKSLLCYEKALRFMPNDTLTQMLYGCSLFLTGHDAKAKKVLQQAKNKIDPSQISQYRLADDILEGYVDTESLAAYFLFTDHTHASHLAKRDAIAKACQKYPKFRSGLFQLATIWMQLQRPKEALLTLQKYHALDPDDITAEMYLAELYFSRYDVKNSFLHCMQAKRIAQTHNYVPKALQEFSLELAKRYPHEALLEEYNKSSNARR